MSVDLFGWDDRGLIVMDLFNELGQAVVEEMDLLAEFTRLVGERNKQGVDQPEPFNPFEAMQNYCDWAAGKRSAKK